MNYIKKKSEIIKIFQPLEVKNKKKIRIGKKGDGGYILLNDFNGIKIAYSLGINREVSFDQDLADRKIDVFMYDHTIEKLPYENKRFHWKKIGLIGNNFKKKNMKTLEELIKENKHSNEKNMILKFDIEKSEWNIFKTLNINTLLQFKYIIGEFHFDDKNKYIYINILKKIQQTHQIFHLHCNNCGSAIINIEGYYICSLLEISFIKREGFTFNKFNNSFPINGLDYKNCKKKPDINFILNYFMQ